jgi:hypothetical protein
MSGKNFTCMGIRIAAGLILLAGLAALLSLNMWEAQAQSNFSLRFYGHGVNDIDRVKIPIDPHVPADVGGNFTLEFWMKANLAENNSGSCPTGNNNWISGNIIFDRDVFGDGDFGDYGISLHGGQIAFGVSQDSSGNGICSSVGVADNQWHHVAVTRNNSSGQLRIYIDGVQRGQGSGPIGDISYRNGRATGNADDPFLVIGAEKHDFDPGSFPSYNGFVDEARLSNVIRYSSNFTPPTGPFATDSDTVALYHFDEGPAGDCPTDKEIVDSSDAGGPSRGFCRFGGSGTPGPVYSTDTPFAAPPPDTTPPVISNIAASSLDTSAWITWTTNEPATSRVEYGSPSPTISTIETTTYVTSHSVALSGLTPGTFYAYRVYSRDGAGNLAGPSATLNFTTMSTNDVERVYLPIIVK